jgi:Ras-related protein Rab-24
VGKSALVERFSNDRWTPGLASTIGGSFCAKEVAVPAFTSQGRQIAARTVSLGVWDTAGSERYESLTRHYFTSAECAFVCFDLTDLSSWQKCSFWVSELHKVEPQCRVYVLGCKSDLLGSGGGPGPSSRARGSSAHGGGGGGGGGRQRCVSVDEIEAFCQSIQPEPAQYFETSALTGAGVLAPFESACRDWLSRPSARSQEQLFRQQQYAISLDQPDERRKKGLAATCCNQ